MDERMKMLQHCQVCHESTWPLPSQIATLVVTRGWARFSLNSNGALSVQIYWVRFSSKLGHSTWSDSSIVGGASPGGCPLPPIGEFPHCIFYSPPHGIYFPVVGLLVLCSIRFDSFRGCCILFYYI